MRGTKDSRGFTLLEVMVALAILGLAVVTIIQLFSGGLRLLKLSGDHQQAALLADQKTREWEPQAEGIDSGQQGEFEWERRVEPYSIPEELMGAEDSGLQLMRVSVEVRWSGNRRVEIATLRTVREAPPQPEASPR
ncbi:MAG: prepilin-type N-terminal cleavage/methylation domain-containing protein [Candidatus Methylomirabilia bacterium]